MRALRDTAVHRLIGDIEIESPLSMAKSMKASPHWKQRWRLLLEKISRVPSVVELDELLSFLRRPQRPFVLAFVNAHAMNSVASSAPFFDALLSADMIFRDGSGMATLYKWMGIAPGLNLNGTDLIPQLIRRFNGRPMAFFGTQNPHLQRGVDAASRELAPDSVFVSAHGFLESVAYIQLAAEHQPCLIILGMGMPRQEQVAGVLRSQLDFPCLIVCGGAIIDFMGGRTPRAPSWLRRAGLEWAYRLAKEPQRLFRRYVLGNPIFLLRALRLALMRRP